MVVRDSFPRSEGVAKLQPLVPTLCVGMHTCAEHVTQLGGESPLSSQMRAKD